MPRSPASWSSCAACRRTCRAPSWRGGCGLPSGQAALSIALADLGGAWPLTRITEALSDLAEAALRASLRHLLRDLASRGLMRLRKSATPEDGCGLVAFALGKLGARELNYSSDIDLVLLYDGQSPAYRTEAQPIAARLAPRPGDVAVAPRRARLRLPGRSTAAAGPGLDAAGGGTCHRAHLLREPGPHLGTRPPGRRPGRSAATSPSAPSSWRRSARSSGAPIWTSRRSATSTT